MQLEGLLTSLNYVDSPNYYPITDTTDKREYPVNLDAHLLRSARQAQVKGIYTFRRSPETQNILPPEVVVFVAQASDDEEAHAIHRKIWNLGNAPFLIVLLENRVHVYTGFDFDSDDRSIGLLDTVEFVSNLFDEIGVLSPKLESFQADSIDSGKIWKVHGDEIDPKRRVDRRLLKNLSNLEIDLLNHIGLSNDLALPLVHSLIGKYIYIRYLRDRNILDDLWLKRQNLSISQVLGREATKDGLISLINAIEDYFKGDIFPLPPGSVDHISNEIIGRIASVFGGDDPITRQMHLDFRAYDFSFIPIETLSAIYEQFLKAKGTGEAIGAVYTPEPLADYLMREVEFVKPLERGMRVLDPSCGSGIFLVRAYRYLIEKEISADRERKISRTRLRNILKESIFGVEKDLDACYVTELSLILTMLDYIEPKELNEHKDFEFPSLHDQQIFHCDFFDKESIFNKRKLGFDWIIGNPPWTKIEPESPEQVHLVRWTHENRDKPVANYRTGEAFSWRVTEFCKTDCVIGLILHATSLTNHNSEKYRKAFFVSNEVFRITNFSNLAYILFERRAETPAYTIVYKRRGRRNQSKSIVHYAPLVANQAFIRAASSLPGERKKAWTITINEDEICTLDKELSSFSSTVTWKLAMWGTPRDERTLARLKKLFPESLDELATTEGWLLSRGIELTLADNVSQESQKKTEPAKYLKDLKRFNPTLLIERDARFQVGPDDLEVIPDEYLNIRKRGGKKGLDLRFAPHLVLGVSYSAFSDTDFVITNKPVGLSAPKKDANHLRALSVYLNSSVCRYWLFFLSSSWGIDRNTVTLNELLQVPVPRFTADQIKGLADAHRTVSKWESSGSHSYERILEYVDSKIAEAFGLPAYLRALVDDFIKIKLQLLKGKVAEKATRIPTDKELYDYGAALKSELDQFNHDNNVRHKVNLIYSRNLAVCTVSLVGPEERQSVQVSFDGEHDQLFNKLNEKLRKERNQWIYVQRGLRIYEMSRVHVCKVPRLVDWTPRQAVIDAGEIFSEVVLNNLHRKSKYSDKERI